MKTGTDVRFILQIQSTLALRTPEYREIFVHIFYVISICISVSDTATDVLVLNIERIQQK